MGVSLSITCTFLNISVSIEIWNKKIQVNKIYSSNYIVNYTNTTNTKQRLFFYFIFFNIKF